MQVPSWRYLKDNKFAKEEAVCQKGKWKMNVERNQDESFQKFQFCAQQRKSLDHFTSPQAALRRACPDLQILDPREDNKMENNRKRIHFKVVQDT